MSNSGKCADFPGAAQDALVLGIKFAGDIAKDIDALLIDALKSEEVQNEIRKALQEHARDRVQNTPVTFSGEEAKKLAIALISKSAAAVGQDVFNQVKKSPQYLRLKKSAEGVVDALRCSPTGIWFDQNKKTIYILAAGLVLAGAVGMYVTRAGDSVTEPFTKLMENRKFISKPIGSIEVSAGGFRFVPSKREFQMELSVSADFKQIRTEITLAGHALDTSVNVASAGGRIIIPFGKAVTRFESSYDPKNMKIAPVQLGLGIEFTHSGVRLDLAGRVQLSNSRPVGGSLGIGLRGNIKGIPFNMDVGGKLDSQFGSAIFSTIRGRW
jgi:hypothetical protein